MADKPTRQRGKNPPNARQTNIPQNTNAESTNVKEWDINGWLNMAKSGNSIIVTRNTGEFDNDGKPETELLGFVTVKQIEKILDGVIKGSPIKKPADE